MGRPFFVYMLCCADGSLYVGHTDDVEFRVSQHQDGTGSRHTRDRLPVRLVWNEAFATRDEARTAELQIKGWNRAKKLALIEGRLDLLPALASRSRGSRVLRDALLRRAPQERG